MSQSEENLGSVGTTGAITHLQSWGSIGDINPSESRHSLPAEGMGPREKLGFREEGC